MQKRAELFLRFALVTVLLLAGCAQSNEASVPITGLNYTSEEITHFVINNYDGANVPAHSGGGSYVCCVTIPRRWRPGLEITIRWTKDSRDQSNWKTKVITIPEYKIEDIGYLAAHFYPDGEVKVLVTTKSNQYPGYPYPEPK